MGKKNLISLLIHFGILCLGSLVMMLPDIQLYLATVIDPALAGLIIMFVGIVIKKILDKNE